MHYITICFAGLNITEACVQSQIPVQGFLYHQKARDSPISWWLESTISRLP